MPPVIAPAAPHELLPALRLLFPHAADRARDALDPDGVFVSRDADGRVGGAALMQVMPGALGAAWPPRAASPEVADALVAAACDWLRGRGVKVCQAFAPANRTPDMAPLERNGFRHVTQLVSMRCGVSRELQPAGALAFVAGSPPLTEAFRAALLDTHTDTRDCPELNGSRTADELLAGFGDPASGGAWYLALREGAAVGVVLLAPGVEPGAVELSYLGVVPAARGRGFGHELLTFALVEAARLYARALTVSVDARNEPALALYRRRGFAETDRCEVWLAQFAS
jgi:ribosomal protein S18 acetylase RimI-like enzyme